MYNNFHDFNAKIILQKVNRKLKILKRSWLVRKLIKNIRVREIKATKNAGIWKRFKTLKQRDLVQKCKRLS